MGTRCWPRGNGEHGTVDWSLAPGEKSLWQDVNFKDFDWEHIIYCVRDPRDSIASIVYTEDISGNSSFEFRKKLFSLSERYDKIVNALISLIETDRLISKIGANVFVYRIEDQGKELYDYINQFIDLNWSEEIINKPQNQRIHDSLDLRDVFPKAHRWSYLKSEINNYCIKYGYALIF